MDRYRTLVVIVVCCVLSYLCGCAGFLEAGPHVPPMTTGRMLVSTDWLERNIDASEMVIVQVAKERTAYEQAHIPGARFVNWDEIAVTRDGIPNELPPMPDLTRLVRRLGIDEKSWIVAYDHEKGLMAARFYVAMDYLGLADRTALLDGQLKTWTAEGRELTPEEPEVAPSDYVPTVNGSVLAGPQRVRDASWAATNLTGAPVSLVDARPEAEYTGQEPGTDVKRAGHIPGAVSVYWERNIVSEQRPLMKSHAELRTMYEQAGIGAQHLVITYCRTGGQASHAYFTARYLGYDTRIYDGSYIQWQALEDTEVRTGESP